MFLVYLYLEYVSPPYYNVYKFTVEIKLHVYLAVVGIARIVACGGVDVDRAVAGGLVGDREDLEW